MRQSTTLILGLTILGATSGCTMFGNPLSRTDPAEAARERQAAEVSALIARGDYEGAEKLIAAAQQNSAVTSLYDRVHPEIPRDDRNSIIDQLVAAQPPEWRGQVRLKYEELPTIRLNELLVAQKQLQSIGQGSVPDPSIPTLVQDPSIQLAGNQQQTGQNAGVTQAQNSQPGQQTPNDGFGIGFPQRQNVNELHAPDPRPQGAGSSTQTLPDSTPNGEAPRLPDGLTFGVSQAGHLGATAPGSIQPVGGTQPHTTGYLTGSQAIGQAGFSSNQQSGTSFPAPQGTNSGNQLPVITPGNSELRTGAPSQYAGTSQNPFPQSLVGSPYGQQGTIQPTAGYADQLPPSPGGVALENRIEVDSGTISGSATTQIGGNLNPFPLPGQQTAGSQTSGLNPGFNPGTVPGGLTTPLTGTQPGAGPLPSNVAPNGQPGTEPPADQSLIPGVFRGGIETFRNATATVTERGLRTFGAIGDEGAPAATTQPLAMSPQPESVDDLIARIESELARTAPGDTEIERLNHVRKQVNLRMLYLIADRIDQSIEPITGAEPADQEFWQQLFFAYVNYFDAQQMPQASDRATQTIDQLRTAVAKLRHRADLKLKNVTFCHHIVSFGDYERFSADQFTPGQPLLLYSEVENFFSTRTDTDRYRTVLQSQIEIYDNSNMQRPVITIPFDPSEDICRNHRRDFFHSYEFTVPQDLQPGLYTLVLRVTDQLSQKVATSRLNFRVE